jgi:hypothetical protein
MPLAPLGLFRLRNLAISNVVGVVSAAAMLAWFFLSGPLPRRTSTRKRSECRPSQRPTVERGRDEFSALRGSTEVEDGELQPQ